MKGPLPQLHSHFSETRNTGKRRKIQRGVVQLEYSVLEEIAHTSSEGELSEITRAPSLRPRHVLFLLEVGIGGLGFPSSPSELPGCTQDVDARFVTCPGEVGTARQLDP